MAKTTTKKTTKSAASETKPSKAAAKTSATKTTKAKATKAASVKATKTTTASAGSKGKSLVIVESPAKAKTINKYLGSDFVVRSSIGHVRDLPVGASKGTKKAAANKDESLSKEEKAQQALVRRMGIDPEHDWAAVYEVLPNKTKVIKELKSLAKDADKIYLATDMDREGEAIAWHLKEVIGGADSKYERVVFNEITKNAIQNAFKQPSKLDIDRVNAQQARRFLDRVVGFMVSPILWQKVARGLSAGRVQSVAMRLVVEREHEIRAFIPEEYWQIHADTHVADDKKTSKKEGDENGIRLEATKQNDKTLKLVNKEQTDKVLQVLKDNDFIVKQREEKPTQSRPSAPFITSTLQQAASTRLGFSVKKTMILAQRLYEAGHITYMRTDSTFLSGDALAGARGFIEDSYGQKYVPEKPNFYGNKQNAQEAHEAIRPSNVNMKSTQLKGVERDAIRLYELIWRQFVACQMTPAKYLSVNLLVEAGNVELKARGRTMTFDGYTRVMPPAKTDDTLLPDVKKGDKLTLDKLDPSQHFTKPPPRYTEASLVKELEKKGIGRPSTYASIISTIQDRGYVKLENKRLFAEKMGDIVTDRLTDSFPDLMDYTFTAALEDKLDHVAEGDSDWKDVLDNFYVDFKHKVEHAKDKDGMRPNDPTDVPDVHCDICDRPMQLRTGSTGVFLGCTGYNLPPKERCKGTKNLMPVEAFASLDDGDTDDEAAEVKDLMEKKRCPKCGTAMNGYIVDGGLKLHVCGNNPDCDGYILEEGKFEVPGSDAPTIDCNKCDGQMELKTGRFGPYFACQNCDNTRKVLKTGEPAPPRMDPIHLPDLKSTKHDDYFILREGAAGMFLAASKFPKVRETRAPKLAELRPIQDKMDDKFQYLFEGPDEDPDGNPTILRWSRKKKEQYIGSEKNGKATRWGVYWRKGEWVEE
ncbi:type I DNA topoisomerase [uncultured Psychrobacter sp.]|jgi:DNA topoisomerase-1|uniref:type I DNA topoisomerase n=3 Tax=Gammaproteobacteria TaxID=1236 RepID=UPI0023B3E72E|tara:strand:- start:441 stop:3215 length:2775 start_codon:yes stop_codon:yes gene_type:complete